jgi:hypothetical protein
MENLNELLDKFVDSMDLLAYQIREFSDPFCDPEDIDYEITDDVYVSPQFRVSCYPMKTIMMQVETVNTVIKTARSKLARAVTIPKAEHQERTRKLNGKSNYIRSCYERTTPDSSLEDYESQVAHQAKVEKLVAVYQDCLFKFNDFVIEYNRLHAEAILKPLVSVNMEPLK